MVIKVDIDACEHRATCSLKVSSGRALTRVCLACERSGSRPHHVLCLDAWAGARVAGPYESASAMKSEVSMSDSTRALRCARP